MAMSLSLVCSSLLYLVLLHLHPLSVLCINVTVSTPLGRITGFIDNSENGETQQFWNIPFAAAPVGTRRWAPPQPLSHLPIDPYDATDTHNRPCGAASEDCLYLTLSTPSASTPIPPDGFPVLVFIYGGSFTSSNIIDESQWVAYTQNFIFVSINYRLGMLGFFPLVELTQENNRLHGRNTSGNQGVQDQTAALQWIHDYISYFHGNPTRVTVSGESAGSISVCMQILSPAANGLFAQAILESGACTAPIAIGGTLRQREVDVGDLLTNSSVCGAVPRGDARLECLRNLAVADIHSIQNNIGPLPGAFPLPYSPIWDGTIIPASPQHLFTTGSFNHVALLIGTNTGETGYVWFNHGPAFPYGYNWDTVQQNIHFYSANNVDSLLSYYNSTHSYNYTDNYYRMLVDSTSAVEFHCPARMLARAMSSNSPSSSVYLYQFNYIPPTNSYAWLNVSVHTQEMSYVWRTQWPTTAAAPAAAIKSDDVADEDLIMAAQIQNLWMRFVLTGNPNTENAIDSKYNRFFPQDPLPIWPSYSVHNNLSLYIHNYNTSENPSTSSSSHFSIKASIDAGQCDLWDASVLPDWYDPIVLTTDDWQPIIGAQHIGCYADREPQRAMYAIADPTTPDQCYTLVKQAGISLYFAMQFGSECWAANTTAEYARYGKSNNCIKGCMTDPLHECGGALANDVYQIIERRSRVAAEGR